jgi:hypothetical protein
MPTENRDHGTEIRELIDKLADSVRDADLDGLKTLYAPGGGVIRRGSAASGRRSGSEIEQLDRGLHTISSDRCVLR